MKTKIKEVKKDETLTIICECEWENIRKLPLYGNANEDRCERCNRWLGFLPDEYYATCD